ncbi:MAG: hypothetical protein LBH25_08410 [Fibromonadaceae bacterium]|jgi:hypothetical protein|nr:hypothetical protein [Fibromonadaceae bacterium]
MAFFVPFALGAAAAAAGFHFLKHHVGGECSCGCDCGADGKCECDPDCDCGCNSTSSIKKRAVKTAGYALEKIKSGLHTLENNINESTVEKVKNGLQVAENKIAVIQEKLKEEEKKGA